MGLITKINCPDPAHTDNTPSCGVYSDGSAYCFGCFKYFKNVGLPGTIKKEVPKESIEETYKYIDTLPKVTYRGLEFPHDNNGYYITWPDRSYYKLRSWTATDSASRYKSPSGHSSKWLYLEGKEVGQLFIVEGEINAISLHKAYNKSSILSPGSAAGLGDQKIQRNLDFFRVYNSIIVFSDNDKAGVIGALKCKEILKEVNLNIRITLLDKDFNELLVEGGIHAIQEKLKSLEVF